MANLGKKNGVHVARFKGKEYKKSLKATDRQDAEAALLEVQRVIHRLTVGMLMIPDGVDPGDFILSGGTLTAPVPAPEPRSVPALTAAIDEYLGNRGHLAESNRCTIGVHLRNLKRWLGEKVDNPIDRVRKEDLEGYLQARRKLRAPSTVAKERDTIVQVEALRRFCGAGLFVPAPGHVFLVVRLPDLPLRALAAVCERRFGKSTLADVFNSGRDPYAHAAADLAGLDAGTFAALQHTAPDRHGHWLRVARALLRAAPLALSEGCVLVIARAEFGLDDLGLSQLQVLHEQLRVQTFPELGSFLEDDTVAVLAANLGTTPDDVQERLRFYFRRELPSPLQLREWFLGQRRSSNYIEQRLRTLLEHCHYRPPSDPPLERQPYGGTLS